MEFEEFPKMVYPPKGGTGVVVQNGAEEAELLATFLGVEQPEAGPETESVPETVTEEQAPTEDAGPEAKEVAEPLSPAAKELARKVFLAQKAKDRRAAKKAAGEEASGK